MHNPNKIKVAVIRQEGSNGDREMISAFYAAGFEVPLRSVIPARRMYTEPSQPGATIPAPVCMNRESHAGGPGV
jgi:hypothetical protein